MKKKNVVIAIVAVALALLMLLPIPTHLKDGGTVKYTAFLYQVTKIHSLTSKEEMEAGKEFHEGLIVEILGLEVFNNVK